MINNYGIIQRLVEVSDAEFILNLRTDSKLSRYLTKTEDDIQGQIKWIEEYKHRESLGKEYYFITIDDFGNRFGVNRLYNFEKDSFEVGSWLFASDSNPSISILSDLSTREFGFNLSSDLKFCRFEVRKDNLSVVSYHNRFKPNLIGEDDTKFYFKLMKSDFEQYKNKLLKLYGYGHE